MAGLGGARPKASIVDQDNRLVIAKSPSRTMSTAPKPGKKSSDVLWLIELR
jgi:hypothetical protein